MVPPACSWRGVAVIRATRRATRGTGSIEWTANDWRRWTGLAELSFKEQQLGEERQAVGVYCQARKHTRPSGARAPNRRESGSDVLGAGMPPNDSELL